MNLMKLESYSVDLKIGAIGLSINISLILYPSCILQPFYMQGSVFFFLGITYHVKQSIWHYLIII